jgi:hypothetical protein
MVTVSFFALSKGFEDNGLKINTGINYLDAKSDPRDRLESYKRITANLAVAKEYTSKKQQQDGKPI